ncbi:MAG: DUF3332 family protein [Deltaproteobacteria bacterium]|jgi:hypothetical protein|nr:DUF3332 family protein [Deltaproteobacteria bacterium]
MIFRRTIAAMLLGSMLLFSQSACIGQMATSGIVRNFNLSVVEGKWPRWVVFLILYIIPVYPIAGAIDLIIVNSIEFHTGTNPITDKPRIAVREGHEEQVASDGSHAVSVMNPDGSVTIDATDVMGDQHTVRLVPVPGGVEAHDAEGKLLGRLDMNGNLQSAEGATARTPRS